MNRNVNYLAKFQSINMMLITQVANGWILELPETPQRDVMDYIGPAIQAIRNDEKLGGILPDQKKNNQSEDIISKDCRVYVFTSYKELLEFIDHNSNE